MDEQHVAQGEDVKAKDPEETEDEVFDPPPDDAPGATKGRLELEEDEDRGEQREDDDGGSVEVQREDVSRERTCDWSEGVPGGFPQRRQREAGERRERPPLTAEL